MPHTFKVELVRYINSTLLLFSTLDKNPFALACEPPSIVTFFDSNNVNTSSRVQINRALCCCFQKHNDQNNGAWLGGEDARQFTSSIPFMIFERRNTPGAMANSVVFFLTPCQYKHTPLSVSRNHTHTRTHTHTHTLSLQLYVVATLYH